MKIRLPGELFPWQKEVEASRKRFALIEGGRQSGKTHYSARWLIKRACEVPADHWHLSPTYKRAIEDIWPKLLRMIPGEIRKRVHLSNHSVSLTNGSRIYIKSSDDPKNLRGGNIGSVVMEEADYQRELIFEEILRPMLMYRRAPCLMISSPRPDWFHRKWEMVHRGELGPEWGAWHVTVYDNPLLSREEIESIRLSTSNRIWRREYLAEPLEDEGRVYWEFQNASIFDSGAMFGDILTYPVVRGLDWGFDDPTACAFLHVSPSGDIILNDEYEKAGLDVEAHAQNIMSKSAGLKLKRAVLDLSAFHRVENKASIGDRFRASGINCVPSTKLRDAGIDYMKRLMRGWGGRPGLYVNKNCRSFLTHVREWEHGKHEPDILAAVRYGVFEIIKSGMIDMNPTQRHMQSIIIQPDKPFEAKLPIPGRRKTPLRWNFEMGIPG